MTQAKPSDQQSKSKKGGERELTKASWLTQEPGTAKISQSLEDFGNQDSAGGYDQFAGKSTDYDFEMYSTTVDESKISSSLREHAENVEREIN